MFDKKNEGKSKNDKIYRWRMELFCFSFKIIYRPGKDNIPADTFTRIYCYLISTSSLYDLHRSLCQPGISRMTAFVRNRNLPFSVEDIRKITSSVFHL